MPFVVCEVLECETVPGKSVLKKVVVDAGEEYGRSITVVTNAPNIRVGTRTVLATVGQEIEIDGTPTTLKKTNVGGVISEGMICDSVMLKWAGGAEGIAVQIPTSFALGDPAPTSKPRMDGGGSTPQVTQPELSAKEMKAREKEARKKELAEKKAARLAKKAMDAASNSATATTDGASSNADADAEGEADDQEA